jgi:hypothetical protein
MCFWLRHILALSAALLLALPPGWCCAAPQRAEVGTRSVAEHGCCHGGPTHPDHGTAPDREEAPAAPTSPCCCVTEATTPASQETPAPDPASAPLVLPVPAVDLAPAVPGFTRGTRFHVPSPPLRLLHCVWLC